MVRLLYVFYCTSTKAGEPTQRDFGGSIPLWSSWAHALMESEDFFPEKNLAENTAL